MPRWQPLSGIQLQHFGELPVKASWQATVAIATDSCVNAVATALVSLLWARRRKVAVLQGRRVEF